MGFQLHWRHLTPLSAGIFLRCPVRPNWKHISLPAFQSRPHRVHILHAPPVPESLYPVGPSDAPFCGSTDPALRLSVLSVFQWPGHPSPRWPLSWYASVFPDAFLWRGCETGNDANRPSCETCAASNPAEERSRSPEGPHFRIPAVVWPHKARPDTLQQAK